MNYSNTTIIVFHTVLLCNMLGIMTILLKVLKQYCIQNKINKKYIFMLCGWTEFKEDH